MFYFSTIKILSPFFPISLWNKHLTIIFVIRHENLREEWENQKWTVNVPLTAQFRMSAMAEGSGILKFGKFCHFLFSLIMPPITRIYNDYCWPLNNWGWTVWVHLHNSKYYSTTVQPCLVGWIRTYGGTVDTEGWL